MRTALDAVVVTGSSMRRLAGKLLRFVGQHGVWSGPVAVVRLVGRLTGLRLEVCLYRPFSAVRAPSIARRLEFAELERASADSALDLSPAFLSTAQHSACYGVVRDGRVVSYAWRGGYGPTPVAGGLSVTMPEDLVYIYKVFTDPNWRGKRLAAECVSAIEREVVQEPQRRGLAAVVDVDNVRSRRSFRRQGFRRCGYVVMIPWARRAMPFLCTRASTCEWVAARGRST